jgi:L-seryl-tRNA(Ser) seleniumtransferase
MALPPWTVEMLRRGLTDVARKASEPEMLERIKTQASELLHDLPQSAARGIDAVIRSAEASKKSVERWSRKHTALAVPLLNASGVLWTDAGTGVPIAEQAIEVGREFLAGDVVSGAAAQQRLCKRLKRLLPLGSNDTIAIASSFPAALTAFSLLVQQRPLVVHRSHAVRLPGGVALPDAFGMLGPMIQEVGGVDGAQARDFDELTSFCAVMADSGDAPPRLFDFQSRDAMQAVVLPVATLHASPHEPIPSALSMLAAGADFVILPGDGVCGGPPCGILVGPAGEMERIVQSQLWPSLAASHAVQAMMVVTLEAATAASDQVPIMALLNTSEDNLRGRAERLATRLSGSEHVHTCQITADDAGLTAHGRWRFPSRQLRLRHANWSAAEWANRLRDELPAVLVAADGEELRVDLRWIAAADDGRLADSLGGNIDSTP